jgi:15-cis-phytoene synthase
LTWRAAADDAAAVTDLVRSALSLPVRLALAYAPARSCSVMEPIFLLDARLARIGAQASEPVIAQIKLAWWRDQFARGPESWPAGEPLLSQLAALELDHGRLAALVDGWEALLVSETIDAGVIASFAAGRGAAWAAAAGAVGESRWEAAADAAGRAWALADIALAFPEEPGKAAMAVAAATLADRPGPFPRSLRPLAVLEALTHRALVTNRVLLDGPAALGLAMRVGIFGR